MKWLKGIFILALPILILGGCFLTPKTATMKTSIAKTATRKTSKPRVFQTGGQIIAVGQEETVETEVEFGKSTPVVSRRSIWTRWWFWLLILGGITYLGLWPLLIGIAKKLRKRTLALVNVVRNVENFKARAKIDPAKGTIDELKDRLKEQDPITKAEVAKAKNGKL